MNPDLRQTRSWRAIIVLAFVLAFLRASDLQARECQQVFRVDAVVKIATRSLERLLADSTLAETPMATIGRVLIRIIAQWGGPGFDNAPDPMQAPRELPVARQVILPSWTLVGDGEPDSDRPNIVVMGARSDPLADESDDDNGG